MSWSVLSASCVTSRLLLCVHGVVYDVGEFAAKHPGGHEVLAQWAGSDATAVFTEAMHPDDVWSDMKHMAVAQMPATQAAHPAQPTDDCSAQPAALPQPATAAATAATATATTSVPTAAMASDSHSDGSGTLPPASTSTTSVRCLIVHGSQTGTASSQDTVR